MFDLMSRRKQFAARRHAAKVLSDRMSSSGTFYPEIYPRTPGPPSSLSRQSSSDYGSPRSSFGSARSSSFGSARSSSFGSRGSSVPPPHASFNRSLSRGSSMKATAPFPSFSSQRTN